MAESVKKRSEIEEQDTWKLEDMIESLEKFEELMDGVEERIQEYEAYRGKLAGVESPVPGCEGDGGIFLRRSGDFKHPG